MLIVQAILALLAALIGIEMSLHPPKKDKGRRIYRSAFFVIGLAGVVLAIVQHFNDKEKERQAKQDSDDFKTSLEQSFQTKSDTTQSNLTRVFQTKYDSLQSNQMVFQQTQNALTAAALTNKYLPIEVREAIFNSQRSYRELDLKSEDLNAFLEALDRRFPDRIAAIALQEEKNKKKANEAIQGGYGKQIPIVDGRIRWLESRLEKMAKLHGDRLVSSYRGMPNIWTVNPTNFAEFKFQTNSGWNFKLSFFCAPPDFYITASCQGGSMEIYNLDRIVMRIPGIDTYDVQTGDETNGFDEAFLDLLASQEKQARKTNQSKSRP